MCTYNDFELKLGMTLRTYARFKLEKALIIDKKKNSLERKVNAGIFMFVFRLSMKTYFQKR